MTAFPVPPQAPPLQTLVTRELLRAIFARELAGGTRLIEQEVAAKLKISRAPVREAFRDLAGLGLIELRQNRGAVVCPFHPESVRGIYRVRMALESDSASLAAGRIPAGEIQQYERTFEDLLINRAATHAWSDRAIDSDEHFHEMVASHCGVPRLAAEIRRYHSLVYEIRQALGSRSRFQEEAIRQHVSILGALKEGRGATAKKAMGEHILGAAERAVESLFSQDT